MSEIVAQNHRCCSPKYHSWRRYGDEEKKICIDCGWIVGFEEQREICRNCEE